MFFVNLKMWAGNYFNIDKLGKGIVSKIILIFMLCIKAALNFLPPEYSDFSQFYVWFRNIMTAEQMTDELAVIPLTYENWMFLFLTVLVLYICIMTSLFYSGLVLRDIRSKNGRENISLSVFLGRFIILCLVFSVIFIPFALLAVYLVILFLLAIPIVCTIPVCYLSGDKGFFASIGDSARRTRGFYILILRDITGTYVIYMLLGFIVSLVSYLSGTAYAIIHSFLDVWYYMCFARICAYAYTYTQSIRITNKTNKS